MYPLPLVTSRSPTKREPESGETIPVNMLIVVLFPAPLCPSNTVISLVIAENDNPSTARLTSPSTGLHNSFMVHESWIVRGLLMGFMVRRALPFTVNCLTTSLTLNPSVFFQLVLIGWTRIDLPDDDEVSVKIEVWLFDELPNQKSRVRQKYHGSGIPQSPVFTLHWIPYVITCYLIYVTWYILRDNCYVISMTQ